MKVTFPHLGNAYISIEALLEGLGHEPITPPLATKRTLQWGSQHSPDDICLPFKTILGNMLEGIERGADTVYMLGGWGPCRLGYYGEIQRIILLELGLQMDFVSLEVPEGNYTAIRERLRKILGPTDIKKFVRGCQLSWAKLKVIEELESLSVKVRPRESVHGATSQLLNEQLQRLRQAQSMASVHTVKSEAEDAFMALVNHSLSRDILRVGLVGEIYAVMEPFVNLRLEERLGYLGVEVVRTISLRRWMEEHIFLNALGLYNQRSLKRSASGYLSGFIGGHGLESVARSVDLARQDLQGVIHLFPLSCMPEIIAQGILPQVSKDGRIPILSLIVDEHAGETGFQTRLEAFVDLLQRRMRICH